MLFTILGLQRGYSLYRGYFEANYYMGATGKLFTIRGSHESYSLIGGYRGAIRFTGATEYLFAIQEAIHYTRATGR